MAKRLRGGGSAPQADGGPRQRDRIPYAGSAFIHVIAFVLAVWASMARPTVLDAVTYEIHLVSPAATAPDPVEDSRASEEALVVEDRNAAPSAEEEGRLTIETRAESEDVRTEKPEVTDVLEPDPPVADDSSATEKAETRESGEDIRVRTEGLDRDYPEYYKTIIVQIGRCLRGSWPRGLEAQLYFVIRQDGTFDAYSTGAIRRILSSPSRAEARPKFEVPT